jgi:hypothetical protein
MLPICNKKGPVERVAAMLGFARDNASNYLKLNDIHVFSSACWVAVGWIVWLGVLRNAARSAGVAV